MEISCTLRLTLVNGIPIWEESRKIHTFIRIFPIRKYILAPRNRSRFYTTIKNPQALKKQGTHNLPQLWYSRVVKVLYLTFRGSLAGTTPILSIEFFLFLVVQVLSRAREDCAAY